MQTRFDNDRRLPLAAAQEVIHNVLAISDVTVAEAVRFARTTAWSQETAAAIIAERRASKSKARL